MVISSSCRWILLPANPQKPSLKEDLPVRMDALEGEQMEFISGNERTPIGRVAGKSRVKTTLLIHMEKPGKITIKLSSKTAGNDLLTIKIGE